MQTHTNTHLGFVCLGHGVGSGAQLARDGNRGLWDQIGQLRSGPLTDGGSADKKSHASCYRLFFSLSAGVMMVSQQKKG